LNSVSEKKFKGFFQPGGLYISSVFRSGVYTDPGIPRFQSFRNANSKLRLPARRAPTVYQVDSWPLTFSSQANASQKKFKGFFQSGGFYISRVIRSGVCTDQGFFKMWFLFTF
jgi:hypothetical protein